MSSVANVDSRLTSGLEHQALLRVQHLDGLDSSARPTRALEFIHNIRYVKRKFVELVGCDLCRIKLVRTRTVRRRRGDATNMLHS